MRKTKLHHFENNTDTNRGSGRSPQQSGDTAILIGNDFGAVMHDAGFAVRFLDRLDADPGVDQFPIFRSRSRIEYAEHLHPVSHALCALPHEIADEVEIPDPHNLRLWLTVNGEKKQDGNTANFIFNIPHVISYLSGFMTLLPGDIISTGTPAGVGLGFNPPHYLKAGDIIELGIDGLGTQRQVAERYIGL